MVGNGVKMVREGVEKQNKQVRQSSIGKAKHVIGTRSGESRTVCLPQFHCATSGKPKHVAGTRSGIKDSPFATVPLFHGGKSKHEVERK